MNLKRLPDTELEMMRTLWEHGGAASRAELEALLEHKNWTSTTVNTYLARLYEKGFVACRKHGKTNYYTPLVSREAYRQFESRSILDKLYGGSLNCFVASFAGGGAVDGDDLEKLRSLLDSLKEKGGPHD
ncbi:Penicillinase repressor [bioreactor metagenome]|uniref:Penicillinase repressor n=1 Tax=bioreactor metagenome TaxID=1076179 RepID=A0A644YK77_9ZZZZ